LAFEGRLLCTEEFFVVDEHFDVWETDFLLPTFKASGTRC
jgi:hypothetical protein